MLSTQTGLSQNNQLFINKLNQLDLRAIAYELMHASEEKWSFEQTKQALNHYSMFLWLINFYPDRKLVPTQEIDRVWHYHILDTMKYAEDCEMLFGRFIHHFPYFGERGTIDRENLQKAFEQTQVIFEEHFGINMDVDYKSGIPADCQLESH